MIKKLLEKWGKHRAHSKRDWGWTVVAGCDKRNVEDEGLTLFLAILMFCKKPQNEGVIVKIPQPGSEDKKCGESMMIINNHMKIV